jgi:hypothetical protein
VVECVKLPLVPVIVKINVPVWVLDAVCTVSVLLPEPVTALGLKLAEVWFGKPLTLRLTVPVKPLKAPTVAV